jgi:hypothetical protein
MASHGAASSHNMEERLLKVTGGWIPLHRIEFIRDDMTVETATCEFKTTQENIDAIMPKTRKPSWFKRALGGIKFIRQPLGLVFMTWRLLRMV